MVVGSTRPDEPGADLALLADLAHDPLTLSLSPTPLTAGGAAQPHRGPAGPRGRRGVRRRVPRATGGNPLLLTELLRAVEARGRRPRGAQRRRHRGPRPAGGSAGGAGAPVADAPRGGRRRPGRGGARRGGRGAPHRHPGRASTRTRPRAGRRRCWRAARSCGPSRPSASSTPSCARRSTATSRRASASGATPRPPASCARGARRATRWPPTSSRCRPPGSPGWPTRSSTRRGTALVKGAGDSAATYLRRSLDEPLDDERRAPHPVGHSGRVGGLHGRAGVGRQPARGLPPHRPSRWPARTWGSCSRTRSPSRTTSPRRTRSRARGTALVAGRDRDLEQRFEAARLAIAFFDTSLVPLDDALFRRTAGSSPATGPGRVRSRRSPPTSGR